MSAKFNLIPIFLDWTGTINEILSTEKEIGARKLKKFFDSIRNFESATDSKSLITIVSGGSFSSSKARLKILNELAINYGMPDLFQFIIAEYCGYLVDTNENIRILYSIPTDLLQKQNEIRTFIANSPHIEINSDVTTYINVIFPDDISKDAYNSYTENIKKICGDKFDFLVSFDKYGKEFDIKSKLTTKQNAVKYMLPIILNKYQGYNIPFILTGGDTEQEDLPMALADTGGIKVIPIAPNNNDISQSVIDNLNVIVGNGNNIEGISDSIDIVSKMGKVR